MLASEPLLLCGDASGRIKPHGRPQESQIDPDTAMGMTAECGLRSKATITVPVDLAIVMPTARQLLSFRRRRRDYFLTTNGLLTGPPLPCACL